MAATPELQQLGSPVQARLPAAFQFSLSGICVSVSGLQTSPSAPIPLSICQHKKKRAQFCFSVASLISLSNSCLILPLLHLLRVQRHTNEKGPAATVQADSTPKHSTWVWLLDLLQALSFCAAALGPAATNWHPEVCQQVHQGPLLVTPQNPACRAAPGSTACCQPDTLSHSSHLYATSITGIQMVSQAPPATFTWHPYSSPTTISSDTRHSHGPQSY